MFKLNTKQAFYGQSTKGCFNVCRLPMILEVWLPTPTLVRKKVRWGHNNNIHFKKGIEMGLRKPKEIEYLSKNASPQEVTEKMFEVASEFLNVYHRDINNLRKTLKNVKKLTILLTVLVFFLFFLTLKNELLALLNWYLNQISSSIPYLSADFKLQILFVAPISSLLGALILPKIKNFYKDKNKK